MRRNDLVASCVCILFLTACGSAEPTSEPTTAVDEAAAIAPALRTQLCMQAPCGDASAMLSVYRDEHGAVAHIVRTYGSCADSPAIHFAPDGTRRDVIPLEPVVPGSPEAEAYRQRIDALTAGLTLTDRIRCSDGARVE